LTQQRPHHRGSGVAQSRRQADGVAREIVLWDWLSISSRRLSSR